MADCFVDTMYGFYTEGDGNSIVLLNYSHPLMPSHIAQIAGLVNKDVARVIEIHCHIDPQRPLAPQVVALADGARLTSDEWQSLPLVVNPPGLGSIATALLVEIHGRCGYFPAVVRMRVVENSTPPRYEPAEVVNLQALRDEACTRRA